MSTKTQKRYLTKVEHRRIVERHYKNIQDLAELQEIKTLEPNLKKNIIKAFNALKKCSSLIDHNLKIGLGLKKPVTKGLTTLCAKTVGVDGRRKKDGTVKKNHVVKKGGKVVAVKKKTAVKKGLKGVAKTNKYLVRFWKDKEVIKETKTKTKAEAEKLKRSYLSSFHITKRVEEKRQATISKL